MPIPKPNPRATAEGSALTILRERAGWTQQGLADVSGRSRTGIAFLESGERKLKRELLLELAAHMGYDGAAVDATLFGVAGLFPMPESERLSAWLSEDEARALRAASCRIGLAAAREFEEVELTASRAQRFAETKRRVAEVGVQVCALTGARLRVFLKSQPLAMLYALVEWLCDESQEQATKNPFQACQPAKLALSVASLAPEGRERAFLKGWAYAFMGNAHRAANELPLATEAFALSEQALSASAPYQDFPLPVWRPLDLRAALRRVQKLFEEAVGLHFRALEDSVGSDRVYVLLSLAFTLEQMGDFQDAIHRIQEAMPLIDTLKSPRLFFAARFNLAVNFIHASRLTEATSLLPEVRELSISLGSEIDLVRVRWLSARLEAAHGQHEIALGNFSQIREFFSARQLPCDAAEVTLEEALLRLQDGDLLGARRLSSELTWIFSAQGMHKDALAAIRLFSEASTQNSITAELVRELLGRVRYAPRFPVALKSRK